MKFYTNTVRLNCKQVTKFQQNRSTSATATASLVRSLKSISVLLWQTARCVSSYWLRQLRRIADAAAAAVAVVVD